jgi:hypothetical protein
MIVTTIQFNVEQANKYDLPKDFLGEPYEGHIKCPDYTIHLAHDLIQVCGKETTDYIECQANQLLFQVILEALNNMIKNGDYKNEQSGILDLF